ncbi:Hermansky-Pudlak syndrome 1 protein [Fundulus heteroclitus]|uniref:Hermansky-Pudlak syndrome 1 protein n=1 Tax=Fundulus heteroclitus TaxID=8078 RepID=UPI00165C375E|nr:Hermansky-Pudlak syndrome 1 protein [Fundulus heteroclitus]XP_021163239.2 Hermansky-Pudlak syndrome 1 protein [Fundulus heteroclitus]XP_035982335.1 Hermansky-Pudlak syndrome 1 protein [Fundulus heteroclitus]
MKCLLIASESAEVLFHWSDREYRLSIQEKYGASQEEGQGLPAFEDILSTLFAPIIISCSTLEDSYTSFTTENNHIYVLHQFDECLYIAVNGDGEEKEDDLRRKLYVLKKMIEVMFGMVTLSGNLLRRELRPQDTEQRTRLWTYLQGLLDTYSVLRENDQSFLVEAVERLIHPQLCELCIEFLERRLVQQLNSSVERAGEEVLHAFVLVHTKLLAFYSSRNASILTPSDLLALIVMAQNMYPSHIELDDTSPEDVESTSGSGPESFYTPEPSPSSRGSSGSEKAGRGETPVFEFVDPEIQMAEDSLHTLEINPPDSASPRRVFLEVSHKDGLYPMIPHSMYCLSLWPGITLVLLTKIPTSSVAMSVYKYLEDFDKLEKRLHEGHGGPASARSPLNMQDIRTKMDKFIKALGPSDLQSAQLQKVWTEFKNRAFAKGGPGFSKELIPWCKNMKTQLCGVYRQCFLIDSVSADVSQRLSSGLQERAQTMVREKLMDWKDFLLVKSKRNITMVSYLEDFPGLVHFICVDRSTGQMIAPSLSITERTTSELGKGPVANYIKNKVWALVRTTRRYLQKGYSTVTLRDGDFYFCYFLWFENETGYKLQPVDIPVLPDDSPPIGMLACDYYKRLLRYYSKNHKGETVKCYELLTVHLGVIPTEIILQHCRQLASKLWEPSRNLLL